MTSINGNGNGVSNGHHPASPPPIPHITANIKSYSEIVEDVCNHCYRRLVELIKTLPSKQKYYNFDEDLKRKTELLRLIVELRNFFVKLYVLNKWCINSIGFSKLIDLLNWLRNQQIFFDSLVDNIKRIKIDLNFAKLPNHDLITAAIILNDAYYGSANSSTSLLPTYNLMARDKLSSRFLLRKVRNLDSLINLKVTKLFLLEAHKVYKNLSVENGKLTMRVEGEFEVVCTLIERPKPAETDSGTAETAETAEEQKTDTEEQQKQDTLQDQAADKAAGPAAEHVFIALDFRFLFALNNDTIENRPTELPPSNLANIKLVLNQTLFTTHSPITDLYLHLHLYSLNYKLNLIGKQLSLLINGGSSLKGPNKITWGMNLKYVYSPERKTIKIYYWTGKSFKSLEETFIEVGVKGQEIRVEWTKEGVLRSSEPLQETDGFLIQAPILAILTAHVTHIIDAVFAKLAIAGSRKENNQITIPITENKNIVYSIDYLTGFSFFINPAPSLNSILIKYQFANFFAINDVLQDLDIKSGPKFHVVTDNETDKLIEIVLIIRVELLRHEILKVLKVTCWKSCPIVKIGQAALARLRPGLAAMSNFLWSVQYYRLHNWPTNWFLIVLIENSEYRFYLSKIKSINNKWLLEDFSFVQALPAFDFEKSLALKLATTNQISINIVIEELNRNNIKVNIPQNKLAIETFLARLGYSSANSTIIVLDSASLVAHSNFKNNLILKVELLNSKMKLSLFGQLKKKFDLKHEPQAEIEIDASGMYFQLSTLVNMNSNMIKSFKYFNKPYLLLRRFNDLINLASGSLDLDVFLTRIVFRHQGFEYVFGVANGLSLEIAPENPHYFVLAHLQNFLKFSLKKTIKYIRLTYPVVACLTRFRKLNRSKHLDVTSQSSLEKSTIKINYHLSCQDLHNYGIIYDIQKEATKRPEQNSARVQHVISRSILKVSLVLRKNLSVQVTVMPINIENELNGVVKLPSQLQYRGLASGIRKLINETAAELKDKEVVFLGDCIDCKVDKVYNVVQGLHGMIMHKFRG